MLRRSIVRKSGVRMKIRFFCFDLRPINDEPTGQRKARANQKRLYIRDHCGLTSRKRRKASVNGGFMRCM